MNHRGRWRIGALASAIALLGSLASLEVHALALGRITVQSALGEPLRGEIEITDINPEEASSLSVGLASAEAFKAAGLDYPSSAGLQIKLQRRADGKPYLRLNSSRAITEPFVDLILDASWSSGRLTRDYTMLFDPPSPQTGKTAVALTAPMLSSSAATEEPGTETASSTNEAPTELALAQAPEADAGQSSPEAAVSSSPEKPVRSVSRPASVAKPRVPRTPSAQAKPDGASQVRVKAGDTASRIAARNKPASISLDQMLIALLRSNPDAFINGNINKIKAGAVLEIPGTEAVSATSSAEARQLIVAQSKDFNAFRRKLADNVSTTPAASADRQAGGKLQTKVEDSAQTNTPPDKLTLSQGGLKNKPAVTPEDKIIKEREAKDAATRMAEMSKNISDLSKLGAAPPVAASASGPSAVPAITTPTPTPPSLAVSAPPETLRASSAATPSSAASSPASAATNTAEAATAPSADASSAQASAPPASEPARAASAAASAAAANPAVTAPPLLETSLMDDVTDNAVPLLGGLGVIGLLGGLAFLRYRKKDKKESDAQVDSTFLESRLQPDSFFGASGGNRVNTNETLAGGSSMAYTPSQMDASGDVDPVAEADVYLAYGRDEQAEDILKEALYTYPGRVAIYAKLLEIYKTRRDIKTFESVAAEAFKLTQGQGPEWAYIIELGAELDPANPLYHSIEPAPDKNPEGGVAALAALSPLAPPDVSNTPGLPDLPRTPAASVASMDMHMDFSLDDEPQMPAAPAAVSAPLPMTPQVSSPATATPPPSTLDNLDLGLGLDFDLAPAPSAAPTLPAAAAPAPPPDIDLLSTELDFAPPPVAAPKPIAAPPSAPPAHDEGMMEFDLDAFSLDLAAPSAALAGPESVQAESAEEDPLEIKFLLAEEFRSLGDTDGARSLADEVLAKAKGPLKAKVQSFLNSLS